MNGSRVCSTCGLSKPEESFRPKRRPCRACLGAQQAAWRKAHPERVKERDSGYYQKSRERYAALNREWMTRNAERRRDWQKEYRASLGRAFLRARLEAWRDANRPHIREQTRIDSARRRARMLSVPSIQFSPAQAAARVAYFGGRCWMCGEAANALDHVKPLAGGGANFLSNLRPACTPCNSSKGARWFGVDRLDVFRRFAGEVVSH